jgi:hypothetical protein
MHDLVVKLNLCDSLQEFLPSLLVHSLIVEEVLGDALEEYQRVVIVPLRRATVVDTIDQTHVAFLWHFNVNEIFNDLQSIWLRELLKDESCLLLVLVEHLFH